MQIARDGDSMHALGLWDLAHYFSRHDVEHRDVIAARDEETMRRTVDREVVPSRIAGNVHVLHDVITRRCGGEEERKKKSRHDAADFTARASLRLANNLLPKGARWHAACL